MEAIDLNNLKVFRGKLVDFRRKSSTANGSVMFNDMLGTTQGTVKDGKYSASKSTLFGEFSQEKSNEQFFTGKPNIDGIGYSFLFRSYRPELAKWQTSDPLGYPDGFNNFAYCNNGVTKNIDWLGGKTLPVWDTLYLFDNVYFEKSEEKSYFAKVAVSEPAICFNNKYKQFVVDSGGYNNGSLENKPEMDVSVNITGLPINKVKTITFYKVVEIYNIYDDEEGTDFLGTIKVYTQKLVYKISE